MITKLKTGGLAVLWLGYGILYKVFYPVFINQQALKQFEDSTRSFTDYALYQQLWNDGWILLVFVSLIIYNREIMQFIKDRR